MTVQKLYSITIDAQSELSALSTRWKPNPCTYPGGLVRVRQNIEQYDAPRADQQRAAPTKILMSHVALSLQWGCIRTNIRETVKWCKSDNVSVIHDKYF